MKFKGLAGLLVGSSLILGCDDSEKLLLDETEIEGPVKIKLIKEVRVGAMDEIRLEVYDEKEKLRAILRSSSSSYNIENTKIVHDEKTYIINNGIGHYIDEK